MIHHKSFPTGSVVGNPSGGYYGKTIAFVFSNFEANVILEESNQLEITSDSAALISFNNTEELDQYIGSKGYDDPKIQAHKLIAATIQYCYNNYDSAEHKIKPTFKIKYDSNIPNGVGLAESGAIITAAIRAILEFNNLTFDHAAIAKQVLAIGSDELNIDIELCDCITQAYQEPILMDFDKSIIDKKGHGNYKSIAGLSDLNFYLAYPTNPSVYAKDVDSNLQERFDNGDLQVKLVMEAFIGLTNSFQSAIEKRNTEELNITINRNYDLRKSIMKVNPAFDLMLRLARNIGVSAKFTGSDGAFIGTYQDDSQFSELKNIMAEHDIVVFRPAVVSKKGI